MKKLYFAFGIHCHQPVGNFDFVFDEAYHKSYQPFLDIIEKYPEFKINIHYTGILLDWIQRHYPEHIRQLGRLVQRGQAEMMSGGFYEPILSVIPREDGLGQIRMLSDWVRRHLHYSPRGMWLAERVWEPTLPSIMADADMEYTVIDDAHFKYSGLQSEDLLGYYLTEDNGKPVRIFPISQKLRYTIPFQDPEVTLDYFREIASEDAPRLIVFADDGEKFGVWPGTYDHVYKHGWLDRFFRLILENRDWIELVHFSEALQRIKPLGRVYLPTASYAEMMHWALLPDAFEKYEDFENYLKQQQVYEEYAVFVRGGFWRNFLAKYPESNQMHKKMLMLSRRAHQLKQEHPEDARIEQALDHIWAGQCNCPYWHGVFGGLYLGHIRHAMYQNFLMAEKLLREVEGTASGVRLRKTDYNLDGFPELLIETPQMNVYLEPEQGGRITELDFLPSNFNILNTMTRRKEGYHRKLVEAATAAHQANNGVASIHDMVVAKEEGLEKLLNYDHYERKSLIDHILLPGTALEDFQQVKYDRIARFTNLPYRVLEEEVQEAAVRVVLAATDTVQVEGQAIPVEIRKSLQAVGKEAELVANYQVIPRESRAVTVLFGVEFNFALLAGYAEDRYYFSRQQEIEPRNLASRGELSDVQHIGLADEYSNLKIELESERPATIWRFPIETISLSEAGFERVYQSSTVVFLYRIELNREFSVQIRQKIKQMRG